MKRCDCGCWQGKDPRKDPRDREARPEGRPREASEAVEETSRAEKKQG